MTGVLENVLILFFEKKIEVILGIMMGGEIIFLLFNFNGRWDII